MTHPPESELLTARPTHSISVVIPNLDGAHWLEGCLASIAAGPVTPFEVVVADDGSTDDSRDVCTRFGARFVPAPQPRTGFAATANRGIGAATGEWILLLNNDTELAPTAISTLVDAFGRYPDAAMFAPLVLSLRDRETIDSAGMLLFPDATARPRWHGELVGSVSMREEDVLVPSGAATVVRSDWLDRVGLLDEGMTSYLEDIDLGLRIRCRGGRVVFVPTAVVFHWFSGTTGALSPTKARLIERNHTTVAARYLPWPWLLALPVWTAVRWAVLIRTVLRSRTTSVTAPAPALHLTAIAVLRGVLEGLARLPRGLRERREARIYWAVTPREWRALLHTHRAHIADYEHFGA